MDEYPFPQTLIRAVETFSDLDLCRELVASLRWPDGVTCPREGCGSADVGFLETRKIWKCRACRRQFSVKVGTIFEDSPLDLQKWLVALWRITSGKKGVSSYQMAKDLGISQKSAWHLDHRLRLALRVGSFDKLSGEVEADETFIGGLEENKHRSRRKHQGRGPMGKAVVMGMLERKGQVRAMVIANPRKGTIQGAVRAHVSLGSVLYSDALRSYQGLGREYVHEVINHAEGYVRGRVSTNGLENFWSILKRTIGGTYHSVHADHLDRYLDESTYRFNSRAMGEGARFADALGRVAGKRLTWAQLTGKGF